MAYRSIRDVNLKGKRVFIRADFNVPLSKDGREITSDTRIRSALPTIQLALTKGASVILASHILDILHMVVLAMARYNHFGHLFHMA